MRLFKSLLFGFAFLLGTAWAFKSHSYESPLQFAYVPPPTTLSNGFCGTVAPYAKEDSLRSLGKQLFKSNCAACHNKNMEDDMTGPALAGVKQRWVGREELLYRWIRNSAEVLAEGDAYAVALFQNWNKSVMSAFPNLSDEDIDALLAYIDQ
ncbi:MAG: cytochrome c [Bacteroidota bacterium]